MLVLGYLHNFSISNNGNNTKFLFNKRGCGTSIFSFLNLRPLKSIISISHVLGKFFIFFFLPSFFSISFGAERKIRENALNKMEAIMAKEHELVSLGGQAAAAAHSLGTPLSTIKIVLADLEKEFKNN